MNVITVSSIAKSFLSVVLLAGLAQAATSWTQPAGMTDNFNYEQGMTDNALFTDSSPTVNNDTFLFFPNSLLADDQNASVSDTLSFVITAKPGLFLNRINAGILGDWSLLGNASVSASSTLKVKNLITNQEISQALTLTPANFTDEDGTFTGVAQIDLPSTWTKALVTLDGQVDVNGGQGGTGAIQIKGADVQLHAAAVPLPGALVAAPLAIGIAYVARKRMAR